MPADGDSVAVAVVAVPPRLIPTPPPPRARLFTFGGLPNGKGNDEKGDGCTTAAPPPEVRGASSFSAAAAVVRGGDGPAAEGSKDGEDIFSIQMRRHLQSMAIWCVYVSRVLVFVCFLLYFTNGRKFGAGKRLSLLQECPSTYARNEK